MGVEPTEGTLKMPPDGFEVREAHRDLHAPQVGPVRSLLVDVFHHAASMITDFATA